MCVYWPSRGQEAIAAAMGVTLRDDDQLVTTYRGLHDLIGKGVPLEEIYGEMMGRIVGAGRGKGGTMHIAKPEVGVMLSTGIVGAGPPVGGRAGDGRQAQGPRPRHGGQLRRRRDRTPARSTRRRTWLRCGICRWSSSARTTMYAEMTPTTDTMKLEHVADRAAGYGMPGVRVDGNDPLAVTEALAEAIGKARNGEGPPSSSA